MLVLNLKSNFFRLLCIPKFEETVKNVLKPSLPKTNLVGSNLKREGAKKNHYV